MAHILIVDDSVVICKAMKKIIDHLGYSSTYVLSGEEAIQRCIYVKPRPDLIFLDIMLMGISGLDVLKKLRDTGFPGRIYMESGVSDNSMKEHCAQLGASGYLVKDDIGLESIRKLLEQSGV